MKRKAARLWALALLALGPCAVLWIALHGTNPAIADSRPPAARPLPEVTIPSSSEINKIKDLYNRLPDIARPGEQADDPLDLQLFGYRKADKVTPPAAVNVEPVDDPMTYHLSFAFYSDRRQFCIINQTIYTEGKQLPDGARILKIEPRRVLLDREGQRQWVFMEEIYDQEKQ